MASPASIGKFQNRMSKHDHSAGRSITPAAGIAASEIEFALTLNVISCYNLAGSRHSGRLCSGLPVSVFDPRNAPNSPRQTAYFKE